MVKGELVAVLTIERLPGKLPALSGANTTVKLVLCPALKLIGSATPVTPYAVPDTVTCETLTLEFPVFEIVNV